MKSESLFVYHFSGKVLLGEEEGLDDDSETRSDVSTASFTGTCLALQLCSGQIHSVTALCKMLK